MTEDGTGYTPQEILAHKQEEEEEEDNQGWQRNDNEKQRTSSSLSRTISHDTHTHPKNERNHTQVGPFA